MHPSSPDLVFAATNAGLYRSTDGGETWKRINSDGYTRAFWVDGDDPGHILAGPAKNVGRLGTILKSTDGGKAWTPFTNGLETPWPDTMVERFTNLGDRHLGGVLDDGRLIVLDPQTQAWVYILPEAGRVNAITVMHA